MIVSAKKLSELLKMKDFSVSDIQEPTNIESGEITISPKIHIQVDLKNVNVVYEKGCIFIFKPVVNNIHMLINDIKEAFNETGEKHEN